MPIKISSVDLLTKENINDIVCYYNSYRPKESEPIEFVEYNHKSGLSKYNKHQETSIYGFRIPSSQPNHTYSNGAYKYMRWQMKTLASLYNYPPFSPEEELLLFRIIGFVLGKEHVTYYRTYDQAIKHSPSFNTIVFSDLFIRDTEVEEKYSVVQKANSPKVNKSPIPTNIKTGRYQVHMDTSELSLSANSGWKYTRVRI